MILDDIEYNKEKEKLNNKNLSSEFKDFIKSRLTLYENIKEGILPEFIKKNKKRYFIALRIYHNINQEEIANVLGLEKKEVILLERGRNKHLTNSQIEKLSEFYLYKAPIVDMNQAQEDLSDLLKSKDPDYICPESEEMQLNLLAKEIILEIDNPSLEMGYMLMNYVVNKKNLKTLIEFNEKELNSNISELISRSKFLLKK